MIESVCRAVPWASAGVVAVALAIPAAALAEKGSTEKSPQIESRGVTAPQTCEPDLVDSSGMVWDIDGNEGYVDDGGTADGDIDDAYDEYGFAYISEAADETNYESYDNPGDDSSCTTEEGGREIVFPVDDDVNGLGVDVARKVYVPSSGQPFARWLDILTNPGTEPVTVNYNWYGDYGEIDSVTDSADNDLNVGLGERWASFNQDGEDPDQASLWDGPGNVLDRWDTVFDNDDPPGVDENDVVDFVYDDVTIPPGGRLIFMHVEHQNRTPAGAQAFAEANDAGSPEFFDGMSADELGDLQNWVADGDDDGLLDQNDNCPTIANADQANMDGDAQGDLCDEDIDGDGLPNAIETGLGSNMRLPDTDGDGKVDGTDSCPTLAGATADGCPAPVTVLQASTGRGLPTGVTLNVRIIRGAEASASRARAAQSGGVTVRSSGVVQLPRGMSNAVCAGGRIAVVIKQSKKTISTRVLNVRSDCTYRSTVTFRRKLGRASLRVKSYFFGSQGLHGRAAKSKTARLS